MCMLVKGCLPVASGITIKAVNGKGVKGRIKFLTLPLLCLGGKVLLLVMSLFVERIKEQSSGK